jgi:glutathione reductase (NADPH)
LRVCRARQRGLATINADDSPGHQNFTAQHILIATGGTPHIRTSRAVNTSSPPTRFDLEPFRKRLLVVGGGYIACGSLPSSTAWAQRHQLYRGEQVLAV